MQQAVALLNANNTFGQIAGHRAMTLAIDKAKLYGTGVVAVKNSNHFGIAAYYAMMALKEGMVGCVFTNASPAMAVYGTKPPLIGTNPIAIAIPAGDRFPIVLDMSTSVVARGKIRYAAVTGHPILPGWARDSDGKPTQDAQAALKGTLEPVGGPKGSALSLIVDILCGVLTDTVLTGGVRNITDTSGPANTGHFFSALNVARFIEPEALQGQRGCGNRAYQGPPARGRRADLHARRDRIPRQREADEGGDPPRRRGSPYIERGRGPVRGSAFGGGVIPLSEANDDMCN